MTIALEVRAGTATATAGLAGTACPAGLAYHAAGPHGRAPGPIAGDLRWIP